jgi:GT2 family glycosyltransferase
VGSKSRVTIVVRTEGARPRLLSRALESLCAQSYEALDVIVAHDGGATAAGSCEALVSQAGGAMSYLPLEKSGRCAAGNAGIGAATGDYVGFLDDDDELLPGHVTTLVRVLDDHPQVVGAYALARERVADKGGRTVSRPTVRKPTGVVPFSRARLWIGNYLPIQSVLVRRQALRDVDGFDLDLSALEDWDLWLRLTDHGTFVGVAEVTSIYATPADKSIRERRARDHEQALTVLRLKHADLTASFEFAEIHELGRSMSNEIDDWVGARSALARVWRRIRDGR